MKQLGLLFVLVFAFAASFAQTPFTAVYTFDEDSGVLSYAYNGDPIPGISMGNISKVGLNTGFVANSFMGSDWPVNFSGPGTSFPYPDKYIGFTMTAAEGYVFTVESIIFGLGKSYDGPNMAQWAGSDDNYADSFTNYTVDGEDIQHYNDELIINRNKTGNILNPGNAYVDIVDCGFRMYMYGAFNQHGIGGLLGPITITGSYRSTLDVDPVSLDDFTYEEHYGPSQSRVFTITGSNMNAGYIMVEAPENFELGYLMENWEFYGYEPWLELGAGEEVAHTIYVQMKEGLPIGTYEGNVVVRYIYPVEDGEGEITRNVWCSGTVTGPAGPRYWVDFEGADETKNSYTSGTVTLSGLQWNMTEALIGTSGQDYFEGTRSARLRGSGSSSMTMLEDKITGGGRLRFKYRSFGSEYEVDPATTWMVEYSIDEGQNWEQVGENFTAQEYVQTFHGYVNTSRDVRLRFREADGVDNGGYQINIDNIDLPDYYDFYKDESEAIGSVVITMKSSNANYSKINTVGPLPDPEFNGMFHRCITLFGDGPWQIDAGIAIKQDEAYWAAYKLHGVWTAVEMVENHATLNVPASVVGAANNEIELLVGYGRFPTLPVELSSFSATITAQNYVQLSWTSQSETNLLGYKVYRNIDTELSSATLVSPLIAGNNSSSAQTYTYLDTELEQDGTYYYWLESVDLDGSSAFHGPINVVFSAEGGEGDSPSVPFVTRLENAYPNPFNPNTNIRYQLKDAGNVKIEIFNARGQLVRSFERNHDAAGFYQINWDGRDSFGNYVSSGVYQYKMSSGKYHSTKKMVLKK